MLRLFALALTALAASGCLVLNDFDDLRGGGGAGAGGGSGADGPVTGGAPPENPCALGLVPDVCGPDRKCTLTSPLQGVPGGVECGPSGPKPAWDACDTDADCVDGSWCDRYLKTCKPWCTSAAQCPAEAECIGARNADKTPVLGLTVCTAHCLPSLPNEVCGPGVNCIVEDLGAVEGDCAKAGTEGAGCICANDAECQVALRCQAEQCWPWCTNGSCDGGGTCQPQEIEFTYAAGIVLAICDPAGACQ